jgi:ATP-dependent DNA helicase RecG
MADIYEQEEADFDESDVRYLLQTGRGPKTEFYPTIPDDKERLAATACSLANSGGGQIVLGVREDSTVVGIEGDDIESKAVEIINTLIEPRFDLKLVTSNVEVDDKDIIVIIVDEFQELPLAADGRFYRRHQKDDVRLTPRDVAKLMERTDVS